MGSERFGSKRMESMKKTGEGEECCEEREMAG